MSQTSTLIFFLLILLGIGMQCQDPSIDWPEYHGSSDRNHYSPLSEITQDNIDQLQLAWTYDGGGADLENNRSQIQCNPLIIEGVLYGVTADNQVFALDGASGEEQWKTDFSDPARTNSRGLTYFEDDQGGRLFFGAGKYLMAIRATDGQLISSFGQGGRILLSEGIRRPGSDDNVNMSTPPTLFKDKIIVGCRVSESEYALLGDIRAFNVWTGALEWTFKTIPEAGSPGAETWLVEDPRRVAGGANAWMGMAIDRDKGIVYAPTGSAGYDFYGGNRPGDNLYANCLLALDAETGKKIWHYQLVRHDIWDRDPPAPPNLLTIQYQGQNVEVVSIVTKQGHVFVFDRMSGEPIFPIVDSVFQQTAMPGEYVSRSQPIPLLPEPFTRQGFTEEDLSPWVPNRDSVRSIIQASQTGNPYIPITEQRTIFFPGTDGGAQWGGAAVDKEGTLYVPAKEIPVFTSLIPRENTKQEKKITGESLYRAQCAACHGEDRRGSADQSYPSLLQMADRSTPKEVLAILEKGIGKMPSFSHISTEERQAIVQFLFGQTTEIEQKEVLIPALPYRHTGYNRWYGDNDLPISQPPWGTLTAINMHTGQRKWQVPLGAYPDLVAQGIPETGTDNYGGPLVTEGGLVFIAAARDAMMRVFDKETGAVVWKHELPAAGFASPATYAIRGKQYVVIACGGGKLNTPSGSQYVAFALP